MPSGKLDSRRWRFSIATLGKIKRRTCADCSRLFWSNFVINLTHIVIYFPTSTPNTPRVRVILATMTLWDA